MARVMRFHPNAVLRFLIVLAALAVPGGDARAQFVDWDAADPDRAYLVQVENFSLCIDAACNSKVDIISSASSFEIARQTPNASAGNYVPPGTSVPFGTYSGFSITISQTLRLAGRVDGTAGGGEDCITPGGAANLDQAGNPGGTVAIASALVADGAGTPAATTFVIPALNGAVGPGTAVTAGGSITLNFPFGAPATLNEGEQMPPFQIRFNMPSAGRAVDAGGGSLDVGGGNCLFALGAPQMVVIVDGATLATVNLL